MSLSSTCDDLASLLDKAASSLAAVDMPAFSRACLVLGAEYRRVFTNRLRLVTGTIPLCRVNALLSSLSPGGAESRRSRLTSSQLRKCLTLSFAADMVCATPQRRTVEVVQAADDSDHHRGAPDNDRVVSTASASHLLTSFVTRCSIDGGRTLPAVLRSISGSATVESVADVLLKFDAPTRAAASTSCSRKSLMARTRTSQAVPRPRKQARVGGVESDSARVAATSGVAEVHQVEVQAGEPQRAISPPPPPAEADLAVPLDERPRASPTALERRLVELAVGTRLGGGTFGTVCVTAFPEPAVGQQAPPGGAIVAKKSPRPPKPCDQQCHFPVSGVAAPGGAFVTAHAVRGVLDAMILPPAPKDWKSTQCLLREKMLLDTLRHPNILRCYGSVTDDSGIPHLYLELCVGTLEDLLRDGSLTLRDRVRLAWQICAAMAHVHSSGYLHADLKTNNILVLKEHGEWAARVSDFGCARRLFNNDHVPLRADSRYVTHPEMRAAREAEGVAGARARRTAQASEVLTCEEKVLSRLLPERLFSSDGDDFVLRARLACRNKEVTDCPSFLDLQQLFFQYCQRHFSDIAGGAQVAVAK
jgi:hypothetical protein